MPTNDQPTPEQPTTGRRGRFDVTALADGLDDLLRDADHELASRYPGTRAGRQPVHTVYVPPDRLEHDLVTAWGSAATEALDAHRDSFSALLRDAGVEEAR